jgi:hypothetical protein
MTLTGIIDSPLQPAYEANLMCEMRAQAPKYWYSLCQHVTDFHLLEVNVELQKKYSPNAENTSMVDGRECSLD